MIYLLASLGITNENRDNVTAVVDKRDANATQCGLESGGSFLLLIAEMTNFFEDLNLLGGGSADERRQ